MDTLPCFQPFFKSRRNLLFPVRFSKMGTALKGMRFEKRFFFLLKLTNIQREAEGENCGVASPENVPIHLLCLHTHGYSTDINQIFPLKVDTPLTKMQKRGRSAFPEQSAYSLGGRVSKTYLPSC